MDYHETSTNINGVVTDLTVCGLKPQSKSMHKMRSFMVGALCLKIMFSTLLCFDVSLSRLKDL